VPKFLLFVVADALTGHNVVIALCTEHFSAEATVVPPDEDRHEELVAAHALGYIFIVDPFLTRTQQLSYFCPLLHPIAVYLIISVQTYSSNKT
jgi:hypothetical protein